MVENVAPTQTWEALQADASAQLVDVRTDAEWNFVGVPDLNEAGKQAVRGTAGRSRPSRRHRGLESRWPAVAPALRSEGDTANQYSAMGNCTPISISLKSGCSGKSSRIACPS